MTSKMKKCDDYNCHTFFINIRYVCTSILGYSSTNAELLRTRDILLLSRAISRRNWSTNRDIQGPPRLWSRRWSDKNTWSHRRNNYLLHSSNTKVSLTGNWVRTEFDKIEPRNVSVEEVPFVNGIDKQIVISPVPVKLTMSPGSLQSISEERNFERHPPKILFQMSP